ncbi:hypothetical protein L1987_40316 [Smallanthus sonchifolius]|uniref:Uncharacterized protein n=1 Tax=Smallanthus sonchifolius TaxID=185202 RepID=A0ACB9GSS6_9ASTR|nr:hypothetical protein L1987_40316 [Smallanthus sonchifolius]
MWVPKGAKLRSKVLDEAHKSRYSMHSGTMKMYQDLKKEYWWPNMKNDVTGYDIVDRLTKSAHFLPIRETYSLEKVEKVFINEIVSKHGVPSSIVSDRDTRFTSRFWKRFHESRGTRLNISMAYHPSKRWRICFGHAL